MPKPDSPMQALLIVVGVCALVAITMAIQSADFGQLQATLGTRP